MYRYSNARSAGMKLTRKHIETIVLVKFALSATFLAIYFLPAPMAGAVGVASNLVWLWKV